jgi:hypothetical protein
MGQQCSICKKGYHLVQCSICAYSICVYCCKHEVYNSYTSKYTNITHYTCNDCTSIYCKKCVTGHNKNKCIDCSNYRCGIDKNNSCNFCHKANTHIVREAKFFCIICYKLPLTMNICCECACSKDKIDKDITTVLSLLNDKFADPSKIIAGYWASDIENKCIFLDDYEYVDVKCDKCDNYDSSYYI